MRRAVFITAVLGAILSFLGSIGGVLYDVRREALPGGAEFGIEDGRIFYDTVLPRRRSRVVTPGWHFTLAHPMSLLLLPRFTHGAFGTYIAIPLWIPAFACAVVGSAIPPPTPPSPLSLMPLRPPRPSADHPLPRMRRPARFMTADTKGAFE
jgi:hypothetical protein